MGSPLSSLLHKEKQRPRKEARGIDGKPWKDVERVNVTSSVKVFWKQRVRHTRFAV